MSLLATDYQDKYGLDQGTKEQYGAKTQLDHENRALKQYGNLPQPDPTAPPATPGTPPAPPATGTAPASPPMKGPAGGFGPSSGLGTEPGSAPPVGGMFRGMGPSANLVPAGQEGVPVAPPGGQLPSVMTRSTADALIRMASMPNVSPIIRLYARIAAQKYKGGV
jgi:hypothetical protein